MGLNYLVLTEPDTPAGRVRASGLGAATSIDLIAIGFSRTEEDAILAEKMAGQLLRACRSILGLAQVSREEVHQITGLEDYEVLRAFSLMELGRRTEKAGKGEFDALNCADQVAEMLSHLRYAKQEEFYVILLDAQSQVIQKKSIHKGTLTMSVVGPREVFREAIREGACSIIVAHNHPSGDATPSPEDIQVTLKLVEIGKMLDIPVLDHVIIGDRARVTSLKSKGYIK